MNRLDELIGEYSYRLRQRVPAQNVLHDLNRKLVGAVNERMLNLSF
jgi:hypothetical protein